MRDGASSADAAIDDAHGDTGHEEEGAEASASPPPPLFDDSITSEIAALIDDGRTYAKAEVAFQKIRAKIAGKHIAIALVCGIIAIVLLHIAFLALAVGLVIALAPLVTIWGAIGIVVGALVLLVVLLGLKAKSSGQKLAGLFASDEKDEETA
ncbi:MAG: phage holin family protein [Pseudomonadota bacterium]